MNMFLGFGELECSDQVILGKGTKPTRCYCFETLPNSNCGVSGQDSHPASQRKMFQTHLVRLVLFPRGYYD